MKVLAIFDFDGTITNKDTLLEFTRFSQGNLRFIIGFLLLSPILLLYKLRWIPNWRAKERYLRYFFAGKMHADLIETGSDFCSKTIPSLLRKSAMKRIDEYKQMDDAQLVLATASADLWVKPWAMSHSFHLISTELETSEGKLTGRIKGKNCHGKAKLEAVLDAYDFSSYDEVHFYGDSSGDKVFKEKVTHFYYREFE